MQFKLVLALGLLLLQSFGFAQKGWAQEADDGLKLSIRKNFGYKAGSRIQGSFSLEAHGPDDVVHVLFFIDENIVDEVGSAPFKIAFSTSRYTLGDHCISATAELANGERLASERVCYTFLGADAVKSEVTGFVAPLVIGLVALTLGGTLVTSLLTGRKGGFKLGAYSVAGGSVCPRCALPYSRHFISPNLIVGKLERCPHCGKWAIVRRATTIELEQAEERYRGYHGEVQQPVEDEVARLRKQIEDTRYES